MNSVADVWDNVLSQLKGELSETTIATWFDELEAVDIQGNTFILHCSNDFKKGYIESLFVKNIKASLRDIFSTDFEVQIPAVLAAVEQGVVPETRVDEAVRRVLTLKQKLGLFG